jgi:beta-mannanase
VVLHVRSRLGANAKRVAFIWAPNSANGYPFPGGAYANEYTVSLNSTSDPYSPYYPGDDVVDCKFPWLLGVCLLDFNNALVMNVFSLTSFRGRSFNLP